MKYVILGSSMLLAWGCAGAPPAPTPSATGPSPALPTVNEALASASFAPLASASAPPPAASASAAAPPPPPDEDPLPKGFVRVAEEGTTPCGSLLVETPLEKDGDRTQRFVRVLRGDGKQAYEAHGRSYKLDPADKNSETRMYLSVEFCGDLTGDDVPELVLTERTLGAHCCYTHYVVSMTSPSKRLMMWEKGDMGTPLIPVRYRPGPWQIEGQVVFWPPFKVDDGDPALSYAGAPVVPVVFSLRAGEYRLTSLSFPEAYRRSRDAIEAFCKGSEDCDGAFIAWIDSLAIGDWKKERSKPMYKGLVEAFDRRAAATSRAMLRALGSESSPAKLAQ